MEDLKFCIDRTVVAKWNEDNNGDYNDDKDYDSGYNGRSFLFTALVLIIFDNLSSV